MHLPSIAMENIQLSPVLTDPESITTASRSPEVRSYSL